MEARSARSAGHSGPRSDGHRQCAAVPSSGCRSPRRGRRSGTGRSSVSNPQKVYFPDARRAAAERSPWSSYYAALGDVAHCGRCGTGPRTCSGSPTASTARRSTRSGCHRRRRMGLRRVTESPSPADARPRRCARATRPTLVWAAQYGTITFHPWPSRRPTSSTPTCCASTSIRSRAPTSATRSGWPWSCSAPAARRARRHRLPEDVRRPRRPRRRADRAAAGRSHEVRRARAGDRPRARTARTRPRHVGVVEGGARTAGVRRLQPECARPHDRVGLHRARQARATVSTPVTWDELPTVDTQDFTIAHGAGTGCGRSATCRRRCTKPRLGLEPLLDWVERDERNGEGETPYPPNYPKMPGEPPRVQPSKKVAEHWEDGS